MGNWSFWIAAAAIWTSATVFGTGEPGYISCAVRGFSPPYFQAVRSSVQKVIAPGLRGYVVGSGSNGTIYDRLDGRKSKGVKLFSDKTRWDRETDFVQVLLNGTSERNTHQEIFDVIQRDAARGIAVGLKTFAVKSIDLDPLDPTKKKTPALEYGDDFFVGRSVYSVENDFTIPEPIRTAVRDSYITRLGTFETYAKTHLQGVTNILSTKDIARTGEFTLPFLFMSIGYSNETGGHFGVTLLIKSDGVIVDPETLDLYLVDPS